jgi:outer membrane immunogenic protein
MVRKSYLTAVSFFSLLSAASAADLPSHKSPPVFVPVPIFTWTGVYVGAHVGYANVHDSAAVPPFGLTPNTDTAGLAAGAHAGYNYQIGQFVMGVEGDVDGLTNRTTTVLGPTIYGANLPIQGSIRGRAGIAFDRTLFYATGGGAFADIEHTYNIGTGLGTFYRDSKGKVGWTVGGGVEFAITHHWIVRAEYRYSDYGHTTDVVPILATHRDFEHLAMLGLSYKFDLYAPAAPVVAKY